MIITKLQTFLREQILVLSTTLLKKKQLVQILN